jgi:3'(2'), 5'-bisphosphate nucleotidase
MTIFIEQLEKQGKQVELATSGSSLKLCFVAEGSADIYPRFTPTMEWDTAAANAVVVFAGKQVLQMNTQNSLVYNKENLLNPSFIVY